MRLTDSEREALAQRLEDWFGDFRQSFLVSHLQPVIEQIVTARLAEAEFHIQQLTRARDLQEAAEEGANGRLGAQREAS